MAKTRILIQFETQQLDALKKMNAKTGAPVSEIVRRAVDAYIKTVEQTEHKKAKKLFQGERGQALLADIIQNAAPGRQRRSTVKL